MNCLLNRQTLRQDYGSGHGKGKPLCMEAYRNFFHSYRMPHEDMDRLLPQSRRSNHIVVASCNQFYILRLGQDPLDNPYKKDSSVQLNSQIIFDQLLRIYRVSREHARREQVNKSMNNNADANDQVQFTKIPKIGLFTGENRKLWAKIHKKLIHCVDSTNHNCNLESLRLIEDCLFVLCLDSLVGLQHNQASGSPIITSDTTSSNLNKPATTTPQLERDELKAANIILTGAGSQLFSANRWFDKFLQIIVGRDGTCGINIEHSASEGITVLRFIEEFLAFIKKNPIDRQNSQNSIATTTTSSSSLMHSNHTPSITSNRYVEPKSPTLILAETDKITPLTWYLNDELFKQLAQTEQNVDQLIENFALNIKPFEKFGRNFIKNQNLSPDAFIQLAMQYTFFKLHGHLVSTYESASLRQFKFGRVDNIRANTCEAYDWIQSMLKYVKLLDKEEINSNNNNYNNDHQEQDIKLKQLCENLFIKAITKQVEILRYTIIGGGPDNHLLALKRLAHIRYDDELPSLFTDKSYSDYLNFRLSTSQLPNQSGVTVGYGAVVPDGYGCSYNPCDDCIIFCVSSFHDNPLTCSDKFAAKLEESLIEMQKLCLARGT